MADSNSTLSGRLAAASPVSLPRRTEAAALRVPVDLLDQNPYQPRSAMDDGKLKELMASIAASGLLQPIAVKREGERFIIIAGHRRAEAFKRLRDAAAQAERASWETIPALELAGMDATRMATLAFVENEQRENLSILDTATAVSRMLDDRLYETVEAAAAALGRSITRVKDLRRLGRAPAVLKQAVGSGLRVVGGANDDGTERYEVRRLEFAHALAFLSIHEHLTKQGVPARKVDSRIEASMRRALAASWSSKRTEEYARDIIKGKAKLEDAEAEVEPADVSLFTDTAARFSIDKRKLAGASAAQRAALQAAVSALLDEPSQPAG
ncbi:MAG: ParB/RepB/Spo0J family partition protein [Myxococcales bacterium]|nr:ParB/RepB/Spo0J family partition protein [Myxococcales bacterium]